MKISTTLLGAVALLGMTGLASAQTKIYVTGSTAFRSSAVTEIGNLLTNNGGGFTTASDNATLTSANAVTWTGGNINGTPVTIKVSWSGSGAGIQSVAAPAGTFMVGFLPDSATGTANPDPRNAANPREAAAPDIALSDVFQGTTPFNGVFNGVTYAALTQPSVGVVAFTFAASKGFNAAQTMTSQIAQVLFTNGNVPLSFFTGPANPGDANVAVIATGRDADSGTRLTTMAETNVGVGTALQQYKPTASSGSVTALAPYPAVAINGVPHGAGDGGESSGGTLRNYLTNTVSQAAVTQANSSYTGGGFLLTYLGVGDFNQVSAGGAVALAYNGVAESQGEIESGAYTLWGYEHVDYKSSLAGIKLAFATGLTNQIKNSTSATLNPNVSLNDMTVQRFGDGGPISSKVH